MVAESPLVHRTVRSGGMLLLLGAAQFLAVALWSATQFAGYSLSTTRPSALASTGVAWGWLFDASLIVFGILSLFGLLLIWSAFDSRPTRGVGLLLLAVGAITAVVFGAASLSGTNVASSFASWTMAAGAGAVGFGLLVLPSSMERNDRWRASRVFTVACGLVVIGTAVLYGTGTYLGLGRGGIELVGLAAGLGWPLVEGAHIALLHRFAPGLHVKVAAA